MATHTDTIEETGRAEPELRHGMDVQDVGGRPIGRLGDFSEHALLVERHSGLVWLQRSAVQAVEGDALRLSCTAGSEDRYRTRRR